MVPIPKFGWFLGPCSTAQGQGTHRGHRLAIGPAKQLHQGGARHTAQTHLMQTRARSSPGGDFTKSGDFTRENLGESAGALRPDAMNGD